MRRRAVVLWIAAILALIAVSALLASAAFGSPISCRSLAAVDGDTIKCDGVNMRLLGDGEPFVSGVDAPEAFRRKCAKELELGRKAKARLSSLLRTPGIRIEDSGQRDKTSSRRPLVRVVMPDGRTAGQILIDGGYAVKWIPGRKMDWCR